MTLYWLGSPQRLPFLWKDKDMKVSFAFNSIDDNKTVSEHELVNEVVEYTDGQAPVVGYYYDGYAEEQIPFRLCKKTGQFYVRTHYTPDELVNYITVMTYSSVIEPCDALVETFERVLANYCGLMVIIDNEVFEPCDEPLYTVGSYEMLFTVSYDRGTAIRARGYFNVNNYHDALCEFARRNNVTMSEIDSLHDRISRIYVLDQDAFTFYPNKEREEMRRYEEKALADAIRLVNDVELTDAVTELAMPDGTKVKVTIDVDIAWPKDELRD